MAHLSIPWHFFQHGFKNIEEIPRGRPIQYREVDGGSCRGAITQQQNYYLLFYARDENSIVRALQNDLQQATHVQETDSMSVA